MNTNKWYNGMIFFALLCFLNSTKASAAVIVKGPYLQNVTQNSITIMWETDTPTFSLVEYGEGQRITANSDIAVKIHEVKVSNLDAGTSYDYRVSIDGEGLSWTDWYTYQTAPYAYESFRFIVYGDSRTYPDTHGQLINRMVPYQPVFLLHVGDFATYGGEYPGWGPEFFAPADTILRNTPLFSAIGNHEYHRWQGGWFNKFFSQPGNELWFAFTYGSARFIILNTCADDDPNGYIIPSRPQYKWLIKEFNSDEYKNARWHIAVFHHPPYTATDHITYPELKDYLVPLFEQNGIDLVFTGHVHNYERSYKSGIYYIITGGGGAELYRHDKYPLQRNPYSQVRAMKYEFCVVDLSPTGLRMEAIDIDGNRIDAISLPRAGNTYTITNTNDGGTGSLRDAIVKANAHNGLDSIKFSIPGEGLKVIRPATPLPEISDPVYLDGYSQVANDYSGPPVIQIDGQIAGSETNGLVLSAGASTIQGLSITSFKNGIMISARSFNTLQGNYFGLSPEGSNLTGNRENGMLVSTGADHNSIGGTAPGSGNIIAGNNKHGLKILSQGNLIKGNIIGTINESKTAIGNLQDGIYIESSENVIGGVEAKEGNVIAHNRWNGVHVYSGASNLIRGNSIYYNGKLGIDLNDHIDPNAIGRVSENDDMDSDSGANDLQNYPIINNAIRLSSQLRVQGTLNSIPFSAFQVDFYANESTDASGYGEGGTFRGSVQVFTDASGNCDFEWTVDDDFIENISATATDIRNNTSEFGPARDVLLKPVADFSAEPLSGYPPLAVTFHNQSQGIISTFEWDFGDSTAKTHIKDPIHVYEKSGDFTVTLSASGAGGSDTERKEDFIRVMEPPLDKNLSKIIATSPVVAGGVEKSVITFMVLNTLNVPMAGIETRLHTAGSGARLEQLNTFSDSLGQVHGYLTAVKTGVFRIWATVQDTVAVADTAQVEFNLGSNRQLVKIAGDNQTAVLGQRIPQPVRVRVTNEYGIPAPDQLVIFIAKENQYPPVRNELKSDSLGFCEFINWLAGPNLGTERLKVFVDGFELQGVYFQTQVVVGTPDSLEIVSGHRQTGELGRFLPEPLIVAVKDSNGNGLWGIPVNYQLVQGDGSFPDSNVDTTNAQGFAQIRFKVGQRPGPVKIDVRVQGVEQPVQFECTAIERRVAKVKEISGNGQSGRANEQLKQPLSLQLLDFSGQLLPNKHVTFTVDSGNGHIVEPQPVVSDSTGMVQVHWILGTQGDQIVKAVIEEYDSVYTFTAELRENLSPELVAPPYAEGHEMQMLTFNISVIDPEHDTFSVSTLNLPEGARFDSLNNYTFTWIPSYTQAGDYVIVFIATDQFQATSTDTTRLKIFHTNQVPEIHYFEPSDSLLRVQEYQPLTFTIQANDPDEDAIDIHWTVNNKLIISGTDSLNLIPSKNLGEKITVRVFVTDKIDTTAHIWQIAFFSAVHSNSETTRKFSLLQNYPNPFNASTNISFEIPQNMQITLLIYNTSGQKVKVLTQKGFPAGRHSIRWDGRNERRELVPSGVYFCRLQSDAYSEWIKLIFLR